MHMSTYNKDIIIIIKMLIYVIYTQNCLESNEKGTSMAFHPRKES